MRYLNHVVDLGGQYLVFEDNVFSVYGGTENALSNWNGYFDESETWKEVHLKSKTPFISMLGGNPYVATIIEVQDRFEYYLMVEEAKKLPFHFVIEVEDK